MHTVRRPFTRSIGRVLIAITIVSALLNVSAISHLSFSGIHAAAAPHVYAASSCNLGTPSRPIQHVVYIQFDNTHLMRDLPTVPSDLEQMPHLLNFMRQNGVVLSNYHTGLIAHTATDILTSLTGLYGDRQGVPISNSFRYFNPDGTSNTGVSFAYWTDPIYDPTTTTPTDTTYNMLTESGTNTPAPWVPYTRAGCSVGAVATANTVLENTATDIPTVFGAGSPEAAEVKSNPDQAFADFVGIGIHCAKSDSLCSSSNGGRPDALPQEPGGYSGYMGLFGHKSVAPQISPGGPVTDLNGNVIQDAKGHVGFPGFDGMSASVSLGYTADMLEHGVPVTYSYISDAHDNHAAGRAFGPGEAGYVAQLKAYDQAFGTFFDRLNKDGINSSNTMFVFTADEGDHFVGGPPSPTNCDGVTIPCTYSQIGEFNANMTGLLATEQGVTTPFKVHSDSAPNVYITGNPAPSAATTRAMERASAQLTGVNPITGATEKITNYMADPVGMHLLHMVTADPMRTPTYTLFADPNYFLFTGAANCSTPCVTEPPAFAWNHGDVSPDINTTWVGMVGPGIQNLGTDSTTWADQTDLRPTMMAVLGLKDDYQEDGRVLYEDLDSSIAPAGGRDVVLGLAHTYKDINATLGPLGEASLRASTQALAGDDATYTSIENQLASIGNTRDALAAALRTALFNAEFNGQAPDTGTVQSLTAQSQNLLNRMSRLAGPPSFTVRFSSTHAGQGFVYFGTGPNCTGLTQVATMDATPGTTQHTVTVTGNDMPGTVGSIGITPGATYWYETVTLTSSGTEIDNNHGQCYSVTAPY